MKMDGWPTAFTGQVVLPYHRIRWNQIFKNIALPQDLEQATPNWYSHSAFPVVPANSIEHFFSRWIISRESSGHLPVEEHLNISRSIYFLSKLPENPISQPANL
jgi:hypothetical protein